VIAVARVVGPVRPVVTGSVVVIVVIIIVVIIIVVVARVPFRGCPDNGSVQGRRRDDTRYGNYRGRHYRGNDHRRRRSDNGLGRAHHNRRYVGWRLLVAE
jgi:hypothetical protein